MVTRILVLLFGFGAFAGVLASEEVKKDLSDPSNALLALTAAILNGDVDTVKEIYVGDDKSVVDAATAAAGRKEALRAFAKALEVHYGKNVAALYGSGFDLNSRGLDIKLGGIPLSAYLSAFRLKVNPERNTEAVFSPPDLFFGRDEMILEKRGKEWKFTKFVPMGGGVSFINMETTVYKDFTREIEEKKVKAYELSDIFQKKWKTGLKQLGPAVKLVP